MVREDRVERVRGFRAGLGDSGNEEDPKPRLRKSREKPRLACEA